MADECCVHVSVCVWALSPLRHRWKPAERRSAPPGSVGDTSGFTMITPWQWGYSRVCEMLLRQQRYIHMGARATHKHSSRKNIKNVNNRDSQSEKERENCKKLWSWQKQGQTCSERRRETDSYGQICGNREMEKQTQIHSASHIKKPSLPNVRTAGYQAWLCSLCQAHLPSWFDLLHLNADCQGVFCRQIMHYHLLLLISEMRLKGGDGCFSLNKLMYERLGGAIQDGQTWRYVQWERKSSCVHMIMIYHPM